MARQRVKNFDKIVEMLEAGLAPKAIARALEAPYQTVITIKNALFETVLVKKEKLPDPNQGSFFYNFWREDRN